MQRQILTSGWILHFWWKTFSSLFLELNMRAMLVRSCICIMIHAVSFVIITHPFPRRPSSPFPFLSTEKFSVSWETTDGKDRYASATTGKTARGHELLRSFLSFLSLPSQWYCQYHHYESLCIIQGVESCWFTICILMRCLAVFFLPLQIGL